MAALCRDAATSSPRSGFRELLLHAAARQGFFCPVYVLMPDHLHVVWMGMRVCTDQRLANRFLPGGGRNDDAPGRPIVADGEFHPGPVGSGQLGGLLEDESGGG